MTEDDLKRLVERLSDAEVRTEELQQQLRDIAHSKEPDELNNLPRLYRMEIKKALQDANDALATEIQV